MSEIRTSEATQQSRERRWVIAAIVLTAFVTLVLRFATDAHSMGPVLDEKWILLPITDLIEQGWSVRTAIDFQETKGPGLVWPYAAIGSIIGGEVQTLRWISIAFFILAVWPLSYIAQRCGVRGKGMLAVTGLYVLMPYHAYLGQLVMSEASFVCGGLFLMATFIWSTGDRAGREHRLVGPIVFGVLLSVLLHNRLHAVAFAGAACLTAFEQDRLRSWPWWVASVLAGLSRLPLWFRWDGPVSPEYQSMHGLGFGFESLTYLAAAFTPWLAVLLIPALFASVGLGKKWLFAIGGGVGFVLAVFFMPDLEDSLPFRDGEIWRFLGFTASIAHRTNAESIFVGAAAVIGLASLGGLGTIAWRETTDSSYGIVTRLSFWMLLVGWAMYALTKAFVFDRYVLAWGVLLPIVWFVACGKKWLTLQAALLAAIAGWHISQWLIT